MAIESPKSLTELPLSVVKNMVTLATSGFGVVVALAWNQVVQKAITDFIDPYLGKNSGIVSMLIYAVVLTLLAVIVTMQLSYIQRKLEAVQERALSRRTAQNELNNKASTKKKKK